MRSLMAKMALLFVLTMGLPNLWAQTAEPEEAQREANAQLLEQFEAAYTEKDYAKAIELGTKIAANNPKNAEIAYNNACVCALKGDKAEALKWLKKSTENGLDEMELISSDTDLESLRKEPEYTAAVEAVRKNKEKSFEELKRRVAETPPKIIVPNELDKSKPAMLLVTLHGFGDGEEMISEKWRDVAEQFGAIIVAPRAPHDAAVGGYQWGDVADAEYVVDLAIDRAKKQHSIDEKRIILTGFSQGGYMAFNLGLKHPERYRGVIPIAGNYEPATAHLPLEKPASLPKVYIMVGDQDRVLESNRKAAKDLEAAGVKVRLEVFAKTGHTFPQDRVIEFRKAIQYVLTE